MQFFSPQAFPSLSFQCRDNICHNNRCFGIAKSY